MLTRSKLGLLPVFRKFVTELWPLIDVIILFTLNIFRTNRYNFTKFYIAFTLRRFRLVLLPGIFRKFLTELGPWLMSEFHFRSISREQTDIMLPFVYVLMLTRSKWFLQIGSRVMALDWCWLGFYAHLAFLQHEKRYSGAKIRSSDSSVFSRLFRCFSLRYFTGSIE